MLPWWLFHSAGAEGWLSCGRGHGGAGRRLRVRVGRGDGACAAAGRAPAREGGGRVHSTAGAGNMRGEEGKTSIPGLDRWHEICDLDSSGRPPPGVSWPVCAGPTRATEKPTPPEPTPPARRSAGRGRLSFGPALIRARIPSGDLPSPTPFLQPFANRQSIPCILWFLRCLGDDCGRRRGSSSGERGASALMCASPLARAPPDSHSPSSRSLCWRLANRRTLCTQTRRGLQTRREVACPKGEHGGLPEGRLEAPISPFPWAGFALRASEVRARMTPDESGAARMREGALCTTPW